MCLYMSYLPVMKANCVAKANAIIITCPLLYTHECTQATSYLQSALQPDYREESLSRMTTLVIVVHTHVVEI